MKKFLTSLKVNTFVNVKIILIFILLVISIIVGCKYLASVERERDIMITNIKENENQILTDTYLNNKILKLDNIILSNSLHNSKYDSIDSDINLMKVYSSLIVKDDSCSNELIDIINAKEIIFRKIDDFEAKKVNLNKVKVNKKISLVNTNTKKGLFKTKVEKDTIVKNYTDINKDKYIKEYNRILTLNSRDLNDLIRANNELSLRMKLTIDDYSNRKILNSFKTNEDIFNRLDHNIKTYAITSTIIIVLIILFVYLLFVDIKKIKKENNRNTDAVSLLICAANELRNE